MPEAASGRVVANLLHSIKIDSLGTLALIYLMSEIDPKKFDTARENAETFYKTIGEVKCPYFQEKIVFNTKGLEHIKFQTLRKARSRKDQYIRFRLVSLAPKIIQTSHTLQGLSIRNVFEREKSHGHWQSTMRSATYYEFVAVVNGYRVRVIVKQVENGPKYFWSIIPFWKMDKITAKDYCIVENLKLIENKKHNLAVALFGGTWLRFGKH